jgi:hypothetical protein
VKNPRVLNASTAPKSTGDKSDEARFSTKRTVATKTHMSDVKRWKRDINSYVSMSDLTTRYQMIRCTNAKRPPRVIMQVQLRSPKCLRWSAISVKRKGTSKEIVPGLRAPSPRQVVTMACGIDEVAQ